MGEASICQVRATVMLYDDGGKRWIPAGSESASFSRVQIYHSSAANTYRVVGRKLQADQQVVINCPIINGMKYNQATPNFHQWRDHKQVWGLNFGSKEDAVLFAKSMVDAIEALSSDLGPAKNGPSGHEVEQPKRLMHQRQEKQQEKECMEREGQASAAASVSQAPHAPPAPPVTSAPQAPPPPPGPPPSSGTCPPAPPPPPPPSAGGNGGGNDLASALAGAKLRKTVRDEGVEAPSAPQPSSSGGGGGGLMGEMSAILARRRKAADTPAAVKEESCNDKVDPKPSGDIKEEPKEKYATLPRHTSSSNNRRESNPTSSSSTAPSCNVTTSPGSRINLMKKNSDGAGSYTDMEQFKKEILEAVKKEIHNVKEDIITALINELQSTKLKGD